MEVDEIDKIDEVDEVDKDDEDIPRRGKGIGLHTIVFYHQGYTYHQDSRNPLILRCGKRQRLKCDKKLYLFESGGVEEECGLHYCNPDPHFERKKVFKARLRELCLTSFQTGLTIYQSLTDPGKE